jgi:hypothetical protein
MKIRLNSDFRDYYDFMFYHDGETTFDRMMYDRTLCKRDQIRIMQDLGLRTFDIRRCKHWDFSDDTPMVVYTDDRSHAGSGKQRIDLGQARHKYPNVWSIPWIATSYSNDTSVSHRLLQVGNRAWWLRYEGEGGWQSNHCESTAITVVGEIPSLQRYVFDHHIINHRTNLCPYAMFAIDFVIPANRPTPTDFVGVIESGYAIDFNTAPGMRWTGMEDLLPATEVYRLIHEYLCDS